MSDLDLALLAAVLLFAMLQVLRKGINRKVSTGVLAALAAGCGIQLMSEDFYWQFVPSYLLLLSLALLLLERKGAAHGFAARAYRCGIALLALAAAASWSLLPVPQLPRPQGPYAVGTQVFRWTDPQREESATDDPHDRRSVVVQAWYPATGGSRGPGPVYIDGLQRLPAFVSLIPALAMRGYGRIDTHAIAGAALNAQQERWPVVLFSPGYGASRAFYTSLLGDLASRGLVVLALDHPYEAAVTELGDGRIVTPIVRFLPNDPQRLGYMSQQQALRAADLRFVLDQLARADVLGPPLAGRLDLANIAAIGHSFGGASATAAMAADARIVAAVNIDGTLYGDLPQQRLHKPYLLIESEHAETGHSAHYLDGNAQLLAHLGALGRRYEVVDANHYSFTDALLFFSAPARAALVQLIGGARGPAATVRLANDVLVEFLREPAADRPPAERTPARTQVGQTAGLP